MSEPKVRYACRDCGSTDILFDAYARWNVEKQEMVLSSNDDEGICNDCGCEETVQERIESCP